MTTPRIEELVKELRMVANMIKLGEKIRWGQETALMDEAADALEALTQAHQAGKKAAIDEAVEMVRKHLTHKLDLNNVLEGYEYYWKDMGNGDYIEKCIECENDGRILRAIEALDDTTKALQDNK